MEAKAKHTPGPWTKWPDFNDQGEPNGCWCIGPEGSNQVAVAVTIAATEADENLLVAAPDLLAALEWITRCAKMSGPDGTTAYFIADDRMEAAKAAVLNAKGGRA